MITLGSTLNSSREAGVVYTKPWMVELVLDLAGYLPEKRLAEAVRGQGPILRAVRENERRLVSHGRIFKHPIGTLIRNPFAGPPGTPRPPVAAQTRREEHSAWPKATRSLPNRIPL
jgi:hypothetical protein